MGDLIPGLPDDLAMECLVRMQLESFPNAVLTCKKWKHEIGSPQYLLRRSLGGHSQSIVVMTQEGYDSDDGDPEREPDTMKLVVCELKTGNWRELPPIPGCFKAIPFFCRLAVVGFNLVVTGGWLPHGSSGSNQVSIYSFISNTWRRGADMLDARQSYGCASDSDRVVYVVGGYFDGKIKPKMSALAYDVVKDQWVRLPDMATELAEGWVQKATFLSGKLHVFSRCLDRQGVWNSNLCVQSFDPATWTWGPVCNYLLDSYSKRELAGQVGNIYVCRGSVVDVHGNGKREKVGDLPLGPYDVYEMMAWNKHLVVIGYATSGLRRTNMVCLLDLESKEWTKLEAPSSYSGEVQFACTAEI